MKELVLHRDSVIEMLIDEEFYKKCPYFVWLRDTMLTYKEALDKAKFGEAFYNTALDNGVCAFVKNIQALTDLNREYVECVKEYIELKRNDYPNAVIIKYTDFDGITRSMRF